MDTEALKRLRSENETCNEFLIAIARCIIRNLTAVHHVVSCHQLKKKSQSALLCFIFEAMIRWGFKV